MTAPVEPLPEKIHTGDLEIRLWSDQDGPAMTALITENLDHLRPWMAWARREPLSKERRLALFERWRRLHTSGAGAVYAVYLGDELLGGCAMHRRVGPGGVDIGYWLASSATGQGHATMIASALTGAAFGMASTEFVAINHETANARSGAIAARLGFQKVEEIAGGATSWRMSREDWA